MPISAAMESACLAAVDSWRKAESRAFRYHFEETLASAKRRNALIDKFRMTALDPAERMGLIRALFQYDAARRADGINWLLPVHAWGLAALYVHEGRVLRNIRKIARMLAPEVADANA